MRLRAGRRDAHLACGHASARWRDGLELRSRRRLPLELQDLAAVRLEDPRPRAGARPAVELDCASLRLGGVQAVVVDARAGRRAEAASRRRSTRRKVVRARPSARASEAVEPARGRCTRSPSAAKSPRSPSRSSVREQDVETFGVWPGTSGERLHDAARPAPKKRSARPGSDARGRRCRAAERAARRASAGRAPAAAVFVAGAACSGAASGRGARLLRTRSASGVRRRHARRRAAAAETIAMPCRSSPVGEAAAQRPSPRSQLARAPLEWRPCAAQRDRRVSGGRRRERERCGCRPGSLVRPRSVLAAAPVTPRRATVAPSGRRGRQCSSTGPRAPCSV